MNPEPETRDHRETRFFADNEKGKFCVLVATLAFHGAILAAPRLPIPKEAPSPQSGLTGEELLQTVAEAYSKQQWKTAAEACGAFIQNYGGRPETTGACLRLKAILMQCHMQTKNWREALPLLEEALQRVPPDKYGLRGDLELKQAACQYEIHEYTAARGSLMRCLDHSIRADPATSPQPQGTLRLALVRLWIGNCLRLEKKPAEAADYFHQLQSVLGGTQIPQARLGELQARIEARDYATAWGIARQHQQNLQSEDPVLFHSLLLEIGAEFLSQAEWRKALACLTLVWNRDRLLRAAQARGGPGAASKQPRGPLSTTPLDNAETAGKEAVHPLTELQTNTAFDSALQLRIAAAYQGLGRAHEAALVLEELLASHPGEQHLEQAFATLVELWCSLKRWEKVLEGADTFQRTHPNSKLLARIGYLKGCAQQAAGQHPSAIRTFTEILGAFPRNEVAPPAELLKAHSLRACGNHGEALSLLERFCAAHRGHPLSDEAHYQIFEIHADNDDFLHCRDAASLYLERHPKGEYRQRALLRRARANQCLHENQAALSDLRLFLNENPDHPARPEALHLQGDIFQEIEQTDAAITAWQNVPSSSKQAYETAIFKCARSLYACGRFGELKDSLQTFIKEYPHSPRLGTALDWYGKACAAQGAPDEATEWGWTLLSNLSGNPDSPGLEDLLLGLARLSRKDPENYCEKLEQKIAREDTFPEPHRGQPLATRLRWALGRQLQQSSPERARQILIQASRHTDAPSANPRLLADCADALESGGFGDAAVATWREMLKWHPGCPEVDRALLGIAKSEIALKRSTAALDWIGRFEREAAHSPLKPTVQLMKARLLEEAGDFEHALKALESLLQFQGIAGELKCEALYRTGEIHMRRHQPGLAIPYYQRIYVLNRHWPAWVAKAYLRSGDAFEELGDANAAQQTYLELLAFEPAELLPERAEAKQRIR